ncbi:MAG: hypothetical protein AAF065_04470 [Verrucomicrobiota bacterium]
MNEQEIQFICGCLSEGRTKYYTFKDHYVFQILSWKLGSGSIKVREIKTHPTFARYANRPAFREFLQRLPNGIIDQESLQSYWPTHDSIQAFRLTLDRWGDFDSGNDDWNQTSRRGYNLVLQLNFPIANSREYRELDEEDDNPFYFGSKCHPSRIGEITTMSWARLDINLDEGTALIEEIQTDWLRDAREERERIERRLKDQKLSINDTWSGIKVWKILRYFDRHIQPLIKLWDEATLEAALWFLREELGMEQVYYHTWNTGLWFKRLEPNFAPPRSLYTKLPQRFGFDCVEQGPEFILEQPENRRRLKSKRNKHESPKWWFMNLKQTA